MIVAAKDRRALPHTSIANHSAVTLPDPRTFHFASLKDQTLTSFLFKLGERKRERNGNKTVIVLCVRDGKSSERARFHIQVIQTVNQLKPFYQVQRSVWWHTASNVKPQKKKKKEKKRKRERRSRVPENEP